VVKLVYTLNTTNFVWKKFKAGFNSLTKNKILFLYMKKFLEHIIGLYHEFLEDIPGCFVALFIGCMLGYWGKTFFKFIVVLINSIFR